MSLMRRLLQAMGLGDNSTIIIRGEDGVTVVNGVTIVGGVTIIDGETISVNGQEVKIDFGPETERTFEASAPISDAVSLSKETSDISLRLRNFNADISVVATREVTAPVVTVTGPQKIVESIAFGMSDGFFELTVQEHELVTVLQLSAQALATILALGERPTLQVQAKVPIGAALSLKNSGGSISTRGELGDLDGKLSFGSTLDGETFSSVKLKTGQNSRINVGSMNGTLSAKLSYGAKLQVCAGTISSCDINTGQNSEVTLDASCGAAKLDLSFGTHATLALVSGDVEVNTGQGCQVSIGAGNTATFTAKLGYGSKLDSKARTGKLSLNTGQNSRIEFGVVTDSVTAQLSYGTHFRVSDGQRLSTVSINTGQNSKLRLTAESVNVLDLDLSYGSQLSIGAQVHTATVNTGQNSKLFFTSTSDINALTAKLSCGNTLECSGSVSTFNLDTEQRGRIAVAGDISEGSLRTAYGTIVRARRVSQAVNTRGMSERSELITAD